MSMMQTRCCARWSTGNVVAMVADTWVYDYSPTIEQHNRSYFDAFGRVHSFHVSGILCL
jgi:hypothetical protein